MKIDITADKDEILGGPDCCPYLRLELRDGWTALLHTGMDHTGQAAVETAGKSSLIWTARLSAGSYVLADIGALEALAERLRPLLSRLAAGHDTSQASTEIQRLIETAPWVDHRREVWDADEWLSELGYDGAARDYGLTAASPPATYRAAARKIEEDALREGIVLVNVDGVLQNIKHVLRALATKAA